MRFMVVTVEIPVQKESDKDADRKLVEATLTLSEIIFRKVLEALPKGSTITMKIEDERHDLVKG